MDDERVVAETVEEKPIDVVEEPVTVEFEGVERQYTAHFEYYGDWWVGWALEMSGAIVQERTLEEAREDMREVIEVLLEVDKEIARRLSSESDLTASLNRLVRAGVLDWNGRKMADIEPVARLHGDQMMSEIISENRN